MQSKKQNPIKPIQLISFDADKSINAYIKELVLSQQAVKIFQTFDAEEISIIIVAGKYRTGKSYILNRVLLNQSNGFEVGPTINACTKGLWMWPKIVEIKNGDKINKCIIIDTEGLGSLQQGENTDIKIFLMTVLLSSYLIYNSVGSIDQKALQNLSLVINLAELLHKNGNQYDSQQLINSFPSFMWLVRDFSLRLQNEKGEPMTSQQYLQNALKYQNGASQGIQRKNNIRKKLKTFFQDRNCFTLIRPTQNEKDLQNLSTLSERRLRPEFLKLITQFKNTICRSLKPKKVRGKSVTPQGFIQLCKYFVSTINSGKLPSVNSHWDNLCAKEASRIIDSYTSQHARKLNQSFQQQDDPQEKFKKIDAVHRSILKEASAKIDKSFLGKLQKQLSKERLQKMLTKIYDNVVKEINEKRYNFVKDIVKDIFQEIMNEFQENKLESFEQIFARFEEIKQKYKHDTRIYQSFYQNSKDVFQQFLRNLKAHWEREHSILNEKNNYLESAIAQKTQQLKQKVQDCSESARLLETKNYKVQLQNTQLKILLQDLKRELVKAHQQNNRLIQLNEQLQDYKQANKQEEIQQLREELQTQIYELRSQLQQTEIQLAKFRQMCKESNIKQRKTQRQMEIFKNKCSEYLKENIQLNQKLQKLSKQLMELEQSRRKNMIKQCKQIPQITNTLNTKINQLEIKLQMKEEEIRNLYAMINSQKVAQEALLRTPQNINYAVLKKNYEMQKETNTSLQAKIKEDELILNLCTLKCIFCGKNVDKNSAMPHIKSCSESKSITFDVSYEYNGNGQIQFVIDALLDDQGWTVKKTIPSIKHFLKKMGLQNLLFINVDPILQDIAQNEQRRMFLDEIFNEYRYDLWSNTFLIQYFAVDLNFINCKTDKFKGNSMRGSKISLQLQGLLEQNIDPHFSNMLMKTTKFNKKTFNFGNI